MHYNLSAGEVPGGRWGFPGGPWASLGGLGGALGRSPGGPRESPKGPQEAPGGPGGALGCFWFSQVVPGNDLAAGNVNISLVLIVFSMRGVFS